MYKITYTTAPQAGNVSILFDMFDEVQDYIDSDEIAAECIALGYATFDQVDAVDFLPVEDDETDENDQPLETPYHLVQLDERHYSAYVETGGGYMYITDIKTGCNTWTPYQCSRNGMQYDSIPYMLDKLTNYEYR